MSYHLFGAVGAFAGRAIANEIHNGRQRAAEAHWHSPLSRLGRCGIFSLRVKHARDAVTTAIAEADADGWQVASGLRLAVADTTQVVVLAADRAALIEVVTGDDYAIAVRLADAAAQALSDRLAPARAVLPFVCLAESESEPRDLPGPRGAPVTVTGLPWLSGLLCRRLSGGGDPLPETHAAQWRGDTRQSLYFDAIQAFPPQSSWIIPDLYLDDRTPETIDLVIAGHAGVFAADVSFAGNQQSVDRVSSHAARLRAYLPYADVIPLIVVPDVTEPRFGPSDNAGYPIVWIRPDHVLAFLGEVRRRGLGLPEFGVLNAPAPGWYRQVAAGAGSVHARYGWT